MIKILKTFYRFLFKYPKRYALFSVILFVATITSSLTPYFYKLFIDTASEGNYSFLLKVLFAYIGIRLVANLLNTLRMIVGDSVLIPASRDARVKIFNWIQELGLAFHTNQSTGKLISAFKRGDASFFELFHSIHYGIIQILISFTVTLFFFSQVSSLIVLLMLGVFLVSFLSSWWLVKININSRRAFNKQEDEISAIITDNLINYETVKLFAQEKRETKRLKKRFGKWVKALWKYVNSFRLIDVTIGAVANTGSLLILWLVISRIRKKNIKVSDLIMIAAFTNSFYYQFFDLVYRLRNLAKRYVDIDRYFGLLDEPILVKEPQQPAQVKKITGNVKFEQVNFYYPDSKDKQAVVKDINLDVKAGEWIALVGLSGAGKTTIIKLLLRFYDPTIGKITIDGVDLKDFTKSQLRSFIGVVPQEPILFNDTIRFNLAYGKPKATRKEIDNAAKMANIYDFIQSLPDKYKTEVGERGIKLSGGQKQRLAIARALLTKPAIIVFDEATSNLDSESERLIQKALWNIAKNRTLFIIAHRLSTLKRVDRIIVMNCGLIIDQGSHEELIKKKKGIYHYLWQLQTKAQMRNARIRN